MMKNILVLLFFVICLCTKTFGQSASFEKTIVVNTATRVELLDGENQPLKAGRLYRVNLSTANTGTRTGAEYLIWFNNTDNIWNLRMVSAAGNTSNHPVLEVVDNVVKLYTNHATAYPVKLYGEVFSSGNGYTIPSIFGASFHWQRYSNNLYYMDGNVGIGTDAPKEKLSVNGNIRAHQIKVETANWPDYVFEEDYDLPSLNTTAEFIKANKHLPGVPTAKEVEKDGVSVGEMNKILLQKIEELTLHLIAKDKQAKNHESEINKLKEKIERIEQKITH